MNIKRRNLLSRTTRYWSSVRDHRVSFSFVEQSLDSFELGCTLLDPVLLRLITSFLTDSSHIRSIADSHTNDTSQKRERERERKKGQYVELVQLMSNLILLFVVVFFLLHLHYYLCCSYLEFLISAFHLDFIITFFKVEHCVSPCSLVIVQ
jgi:hypothetical protein